jgi:DNA polymerase V
MYALIDCNNFFASCEQLFKPKLLGKPLVVLSNNDGCVIARSKEAKALGIPMGAPAFQLRECFKQSKVHVLSSNFSLYGDLSERVMTTLETFGFPVEVYSIDEAFLHLYLLSIEEMRALGKSIQEKIKRWLGLPAAVGFGSTKTLAKAANKLAKKSIGTFVLAEESFIDETLAHFPIEDLWGIGRRLSASLKSYEIYTAKQLKYCEDEWIKKRFSIHVLRTVWELRGIDCQEYVDTDAPAKSITSSRSFGKRVAELKEIKEAVATYTVKAAEKLRRQKALAQGIHVYLATDHLHAMSANVYLPQATAYTPELIHYALHLSERLFVKGKTYKKAGITLYEISPRSEQQLDAFIFPTVDLKKREAAMEIIDEINLFFGRRIVRFAAEGIEQPWMMKSAHRSQQFTTRWDEILIVSV